MHVKTKVQNKSSSSRLCIQLKPLEHFKFLFFKFKEFMHLKFEEKIKLYIFTDVSGVIVIRDYMSSTIYSENFIFILLCPRTGGKTEL